MVKRMSRHSWLARLSPRWQVAVIFVPFLLFIALIAYPAIRSDVKPATSPPAPQLGIVVSYGPSPSLFGGSCGWVASVRLKGGETVRAASTQYPYLRSGARVTVANFPSNCPPAAYTVLHTGAPDDSSGQTARTPGAA